MFRRFLLTALLLAGFALSLGHGAPMSAMAGTADHGAGISAVAPHLHSAAADCLEACGSEKSACCMDMQSHCGSDISHVSYWHSSRDSTTPADYHRSTPGPALTAFADADPPPPKAKA